MKYKAAAIIVFGVIIIGVSILYVINAPSAKLPSVDNASNESPSPSVSSSPAKVDEGVTTATGSYESYTKDKVAATSGTKVLFFHAPWCPQCRALEKDIQASILPEDLTIFKVDYDSSQTLRQKYGVTIQTTLVKIDDSGNLVEKYVAYNEPTFANVKANLLD